MDILLLGFTFFILRPRVWPEYFTLGLFERDEDQYEEVQEQRIVAPLLTKTVLRQKLLDLDSLSSQRSELSSQHQFVLINPIDEFENGPVG